jgi:D-alanyl-D-alanine carboxypeptidase/D-alanyl-D-alanine-endopeptidase (penicillin-binding protein 4)
MKILVGTVFVFVFNLAVKGQLLQSDEGANVSYHCATVSSEDMRYSYNEHHRMISASLMKIVTTATALEILGPDFTYKTIIGYSGNIKNGLLSGNLIINSTGDPTLGSSYFKETNPELLFQRIYTQLNTLGVHTIKGDVVVNSLPKYYSPSRLWEDMGNYYGATPGNFNWRDNSATVILKSGGVGTRCKVISITPDIYPYTLNCRVIAANHFKDSAYVFGIAEINHWWIDGSIPANRNSFKIKAALPSPKNSFKQELKTYLNNNGIDVFAKVVSQDNICGFTTLFINESPVLSDIVKIINHKSNNLFADQLLLTMGKQIKGIANWDNGIKVVEDFWTGKIDFKDHFRIKDGSGLSPKNLISASGMVQLLSWMYSNSRSYSFFESSLAKGGETGTLKSIFSSSSFKGKILGKSGSMEGILGYCGYVSTFQNKKAAFCILTNHYFIPTKQVKKAIEKEVYRWVIEN